MVRSYKELGDEFVIEITRDAKTYTDICTVVCECLKPQKDKETLERRLRKDLREDLQVTPDIRIENFGTLGRTTFKAKRIMGKRKYKWTSKALSNLAPESQTQRGEMSPAIFRSGPYRFYFVSHDLHEPPHVHIDRDAFSAKFWLKPVALAYNLGYPARELRSLEALTAAHQKELLEAWNEYFGT